MTKNQNHKNLEIEGFTDFFPKFKETFYFYSLKPGFAESGFFCRRKTGFTVMEALAGYILS